MEIILIFFFISFFFIATAGYGYFLIDITNRNKNYLFFGETGLLGFFFISLITIFVHLFFPLNIVFNSILYLVGFIYFFKDIKFIKKIILKNYKFFLIIIFISLLMFVQYKPNEDFGYYHLPYITNLIEEKIIFGLSNLQLNQGWNSIWLNITSTYYIFYLKFDGIFISNVIFYLFISFIFFEIISAYSKEDKSIYVFIFALFFLIFLNLKFSRLNTYGLDVPSNFLVIYVSLIFLIYYYTVDDLKRKFYIFEFLVLFSIFSISFRIVNILILFLPLVIFIKEKISFYKILKSKLILLSLVFFILFCLQQIIYTGCALIPSNFTCIKSLTWFDPKIIENFQADVSSINKSFQSYNGNLSKEEYLSNFNWVNNWFVRNKIEILEHIGTFIFPIILYILFLYKSKKNDIKFNYNSSINFVLLFFVLSFVVWFLKAPVIRFGTIYIQSIILIFIIFLSKKIIIFIPQKKIVISLVCLSLFGNLIKNSNRILNNEHKGIFPEIPKIIYKSSKIFDIELNTPIKNSRIAKSELCWNVAILCRIDGFDNLNISRVKSYLLIKQK